MKTQQLTGKVFRRQVMDAVRTAEPQAPRCRHAPPNDFCGGCTFQDREYAAQVAGKHAALRQLWSGLLSPEQIDQIGFVASPEPFAYRTRMDYVASKGRFGLRRGGKFNYIIDLNECFLLPDQALIAARAVYNRVLTCGLSDYDLRNHTGFLRYVVVRRSPTDQLLIAVVVADNQQHAEMEQVAAEALSQPHVVGFHWLHNPTRTDLSFGETVRAWGANTLPMPVGERILQIGPNTFFQNNVYLLEPLLNDVLQAVRGSTAVADLYGGVGTIALHIANHVQRVVCVESVAESTALAMANVADNHVSNVSVVTNDVANYVQTTADTFDTIVVDPPRSGLGPDVCTGLLRLRPQRIVYVSCNPLTQIDDSRQLFAEYSLSELRGYDMFPQTPHLESFAIFERKTIEA
jgi:23S rRNA (uracil-5-)-methyltransferase RumA